MLKEANQMPKREVSPDRPREKVIKGVGEPHDIISELRKIKAELRSLKRDVKVERDANRLLFKKLVDARTEAEDLRKAVNTYHRRYYDEKEKCQRLYVENTKQNKTINKLTEGKTGVPILPSSKTGGQGKDLNVFYKHKYEAEKQRNIALNTMLLQLESTNGENSTKSSGSKEQVTESNHTRKLLSRLPSIHKDHIFTTELRDERVRLEHDLFSEYQSYAPHEATGISLRDKEAVRPQTGLARTYTLK